MREPSTAQSGYERRPKQDYRPRRMTEESLRKAALGYIDRYTTSTEHLRHVLERKIRRSVYAHGTDAAEAAGWTAGIIADLVNSRLIDDGSYATTRTRALRARGASALAIRAALKKNGLQQQVIERVMASCDNLNENRTAACRYARRRRLGPYRTLVVRAGRRDRDLAALARAGFDYSLALEVIDAPSVEALETASQE